MTKLDGDARGGAALSVKQVTGVPIKFIGTGEHLENLEEFHPDRMASRILGMGDVLTLVETAQREFDQEQMAKAEERMRKGEFTLDNFRDQMRQLAKPGPMKKVMGMMPGMGGMNEMMEQFDEGEMERLNGMIDSMTPDERRNPRVIDQSRRRRIAAGSRRRAARSERSGQAVRRHGLADEGDVGPGHARPNAENATSCSKAAFSTPATACNAAKVGTGKRLTPDEKRKLKKQREKELRKKKRESREG